MDVETRHGLAELRRLARSKSDARMRIRVQAFVGVERGPRAVGIAEGLEVSRRPVQEWVRRYSRWEGA